MALCLHVAPHQLKRHHGLLTTHHEARRQGVEGPLARRDRVGALGIQSEQPAAIVQDEAVTRHGHARSKT